MGRRQAMASAAPSAHVGTALASAAGRAVLRGLAVTLGLMPERALLNDANPHLIDFYGWLQKGLRVDLPMENDEDLF
jgi:hypothetical protein